jgi:uncharacterized NAD-dependent epimerase/dehydratase family protein
VGNPVKAGRDVDNAGKFAVVPVFEAEPEFEDSAGNEAVAVAPPVPLPESVAELAEESDEAADVAAADDAVGIATLPVLERVGKLD